MNETILCEFALLVDDEMVFCVEENPACSCDRFVKKKRGFPRQVSAGFPRIGSGRSGRSGRSGGSAVGV